MYPRLTRLLGFIGLILIGLGMLVASLKLAIRKLGMVRIVRLIGVVMLAGLEIRGKFVGLLLLFLLSKLYKLFKILYATPLHQD